MTFVYLKRGRGKNTKIYNKINLRYKNGKILDVPSLTLKSDLLKAIKVADLLQKKL